MKDSTILKTAMTTAIIGLIALSIITTAYEPQEASITMIKEGFLDNDEEKNVMLRGKAINVRNFEKLTIITIEKKEQIDIIAFGNLSITQEDIIKVIGKIDEYKGKKEIIAEKIEKLEDS